MSEEQVIQEPGVPYTVAGRGASEERLGVEIPPYFDRFLEERDRRIASEFSRLEAAIAHNGREIARVLREIDRRFAETDEKLEVLRAEMNRRFAETDEKLGALRAEMNRRFAETDEKLGALRAEMDRRFAEAKEEREALRAEMDRRFAEAKEEREALRGDTDAANGDAGSVSVDHGASISPRDRDAGHHRSRLPHGNLLITTQPSYELNLPPSRFLKAQPFRRRRIEVAVDPTHLRRQ